MIKSKKTIKDIIYNEYLKTALMPILIIEMTLLIMYFSITGYIELNTRETLLNEARSNIGEISNREVKDINQQMVSVSMLGDILQKENTRFFTNPDVFALPAGEIELMVADNGVTYKLNDNGGSSLFYPNITKIGLEEQEKAIKTEAFDPLYKAVVESDPSIVSVYFNAYDSLNRYYPFLTDVYKVFPDNMNIPEYNFYYLADEQHNPEKKTVWTDAYLDPAGQGWMASCITPIYNNEGFLEGVTGIDITIDKIVNNILNIELPWHASAFLVDKNGVILAMPEPIESVFGLKELRQQVYDSTIKQDTLKPEEFNLFKNKDPQLANQIRTIFDSNNGVNDLTINDKSYFLTQSVIEETQWRLLILVDKDIFFEPVYKLEKLTKKAGLIAFFAMIIFYIIFFSFLIYKSKKIASRIAEPISRLALKTTEIGNNVADFQFESREENINEINILMKNFEEMGKELNQFYNELDEKVKQRTIELSQTVLSLEESDKELRREVAERKLAEEGLKKSRAELEVAYENLKNADLQIAHQEKMASIGQLAAGVAHEINNPMGFIISNVAMIQEYSEKLNLYFVGEEEEIKRLRETATNELVSSFLVQLQDKIQQLKLDLGIDFIMEDIVDLIDETLDGTERVKKIVQGMSAFSRKTSEMGLADIHVGLEIALKIIANELKYKVDVIKDYGEIPPIICNIGNLNQVFINLLINASHSIKDHGTITIQTRKDNGDILIRITDTGEGIPEEIQNQIFDPFFTTKEVGSGTGLGLSVSYKIIESHKGSIVIENSTKMGTTFAIRLPISDVESDE